MHDIDWNDFRYVLALAREGSYAAAARRLRIDPTTVARRLREIETVLDVRLFERAAGSELQLTQAGIIAVRRAEVIEAEIGGLTAAVTGTDADFSGLVRVTAVPILINRVLIPAAGSLTSQHSGLHLDFIAESRDLSLSRRETDIAIRLARPRDETGSRAIARRIGSLGYAAYVAAGLETQAATLPWLSYEAEMSSLPQAQWTARAAETSGGLAAVAVNDAEALLQGVKAGLGRGFLPTCIAQQFSDLVPVPTAETPPLTREIWLLTHPDLRHLGRIEIVLHWIETTFQKFGSSS